MMAGLEVRVRCLRADLGGVRDASENQDRKEGSYDWRRKGVLLGS